MTLDDLIYKAEHDPSTLEYIAYTHAHGWGLIKTRYFHTDYKWVEGMCAADRCELRRHYVTDQALVNRGYLEPGKTTVVTAKAVNIRRLEKQLRSLRDVNVYYGRKDI